MDSIKNEGKESTVKNICGKRILGSGNGKYKGSVVGIRLVFIEQKEGVLSVILSSPFYG